MQALRARVVNIPLFRSVPAGFAENREQDAEGCASVAVESIGFKLSQTTFALRVSGDSMIGRQIVAGHRSFGTWTGTAEWAGSFNPHRWQGCAEDIRSKKMENFRHPDLIPPGELVIQEIFKYLIRKTSE